MRYLPLILLATLPVPAPLAAQTVTFGLPAGCTAYLTVQSLDCEVSHHFTCNTYATGVQGRVDIGEAGPTYIGTIDAEAQWVSSFNPDIGSTETLAPDPIDPASFSALIGTGSDSYDFMTENDQSGLLRFVGTDRLTGNKVTIDGVELEQTQLSISVQAEDGTELWSTTGNEYISRDWRMFLSGPTETVTPEETFKADGSPVEFIFPGEAGFLSANPNHGCGAASSSLPTLPLLPPVAD